MVEHWQLKLQDAGALGLIYVDCRLLTSLPFHHITSKHFFIAKYKLLADKTELLPHTTGNYKGLIMKIHIMLIHVTLYSLPVQVQGEST